MQAGKVDKIRCLLMLGADARATDLNGNTYFHLAARDGRTEVLEAFIGDVDVTCVNNDGDTALHLAAKSGHVDAVKLLLQKSKLDARNKYVERGSSSSSSGGGVGGGSSSSSNIGWTCQVMSR